MTILYFSVNKRSEQKNLQSEFVILLHYVSVSTRGVIGQFCRLYFTVQPTKFQSFLSHAPY